MKQCISQDNTLNFWTINTQHCVINMVFGSHTQDTRPLFFSSWKKYLQKQPLTALEQQLVEVMLDHPEYHPYLEESTRVAVFLSGLGGIEHDNLFLHMGLHLALRDQVTLNRPAGIAGIYHTLLEQYSGSHHVEHLMMEALAACLWESNRTQRMPDDIAYLQACKELI